MTAPVVLGLHPHTSFGGVRPSFAGTPVEARAGSRDAVRLLVARPEGVRHRHFPDLLDELRAGDVLVVNTSATLHGEIDAVWVSRAGSRPVVLHVATPLDDGDWVVELRTAPHADRPVLTAGVGDRIVAGGFELRLRDAYPTPLPADRPNRLWRASATGDVRGTLDAGGRPIAYGYLDGRWPLSAYQTIFSRTPGSAEMPSAARPFTENLVVSLLAKGILFAPVLLHTGVSSQEAGEPPQPERFAVSVESASLVNHARERGGRIVAVGTTATRAIESAVAGDRVVAAAGWTERVVTPEAPPRIVDGLVTGWHDAEASHLLLVEAVAGAELAQRAYDEALAEGYVWHEFGDSCVFLPNLRA